MMWLQQKREGLGKKLSTVLMSGWVSKGVSRWTDCRNSLCALINPLANLANTLPVSCLANLVNLGRKPLSTPALASTFTSQTLAPNGLSPASVASLHTRAADLGGNLGGNPRAHGLWGGAWGNQRACESNYWATSTAPAETLWQLVTNLADLSSWHPLITATNAPRGQRATPGLIYRAVMPYLPISTQIFVERVLPGELLSIRLFPFPGLQERVTYRIVSTLCGTCVLYSITLSGWLSPLAWPVVKPHTSKVAAALVEAAEQHMSGVTKKTGRTDIFGTPL